MRFGERLPRWGPLLQEAETRSRPAGSAFDSTFALRRRHDERTELRSDRLSAPFPVGVLANARRTLSCLPGRRA
jgi:hypothetical protein